jgi:hypothetical protein
MDKWIVALLKATTPELQQTRRVGFEAKFSIVRKANLEEGNLQSSTLNQGDELCFACKRDAARRLANDETLKYRQRFMIEERASPLQIASTNGHAEIVKMLLERGADANCICHNDYRPLHLVKTPDVANLLINHGAIVNAMDADGRTPLHFALNADIARLLLEHGAID